jgi:hypothetical protein
MGCLFALALARGNLGALLYRFAPAAAPHAAREDIDAIKRRCASCPLLMKVFDIKAVRALRGDGSVTCWDLPD